MGVPEEIRKVERPKNTIVEARTSKDGHTKYIVRERAGNVYKDGRSRPINGGIIGFIVDGKYVERGAVAPIEPEEICMQTWALEKVMLPITEDILDDLRKAYSEKEAETLYTMAMLRVRNPNLKTSRMKRDYNESILAETFPSLPMSAGSVCNFLQDVGRANLRAMKFIDLRVSRLSPGAKVAVDGTLVTDNSEVNNVSEISRKSRVRGGKDISIIYAYDIGKKEPLCFTVYPGNVVDSKAYEDFIEACDLKNVLLVGDKAFTLNASGDKPENTSGRKYLYPLRRNSEVISKLGLHDCQTALKSKPGVTYSVHHDVNSGLYYYCYYDPDYAAKEITDYVASRTSKGKGIDPEKLMKVQENAGHIDLVSNAELDPEEAYRIYKERWMIEDMFRLYKDVEELDVTNVQNDFSVHGVAFLNFLSTLMTSRLIAHLLDKGALDKMSFGEVLRILSSSLRIKTENGDWKYRALLDKDKDVLRSLDLIPQLPPKRGPGRPRKNKAQPDSTHF